MSFKKKQPNKVGAIVKEAVTNRPKVSLMDWIPYSRMIGQDNLLELRDPDRNGANQKPSGYLDIMTILGKDLNFLDGSGGVDAADVLAGFHHLLSTYVEDLDFNITQMPADTSIQQANWATIQRNLRQEIGEAQTQREYEQLIARMEIAQGEYGMARYVADNVNHQEYTVFIYGETAAETRQLRDDFRRIGGDSVKTVLMSKDRKKQLMKLLNNPVQNLLVRRN